MTGSMAVLGLSSCSVSPYRLRNWPSMWVASAIPSILQRPGVVSEFSTGSVKTLDGGSTRTVATQGPASGALGPLPTLGATIVLAQPASMNARQTPVAHDKSERMTVQAIGPPGRS